MKVPRASERTSASANMTPMIDVVFLLIIFFLVSSHLAKQEARLPLDLPLASTHRFDDPANKRLTINIVADGKYQVSGTEVSGARLQELLAAHQREQQAGASVRIRTDKSVPYGTVEPLLRDIALSGIIDITFAVSEER